MGKNTIYRARTAYTFPAKENIEMNPKRIRQSFSFLLAFVLLLFLTSALRAGGTTTDDYSWSPDFHLRGVDRAVLALAHDGQNFYIGGDIRMTAGVEVNRIARWDGSTIDDMDGGANMWIEDFAMADDGALYAGGYFTEIGGVAANRVARWDDDHWSALGSGVDERVEAMVMDGRGNLYVGGRFSTAGGAPASKIAMWDGDHWSAVGDLDETAVVLALAVDQEDNLYASGILRELGRVAKWDGESWTSLGDADHIPIALATDAEGHLYAGGYFTEIDGVAADHIARWDGKNWSPLGAGVNERVECILIADDGAVLVSGRFTEAGGEEAKRVARWDGQNWHAFGAGFEESVLTLMFGPDGALYVGGGQISDDEVVNSLTYWDGARWRPVWNGQGVDGDINAFLVDGAALYAGGFFGSAGGADSWGIARWDGEQWSALGRGLIDTPYIYGSARALAMDDEGGLYVGGNIKSIDGVAINGIAKWDGGQWSPLGSGCDTTYGCSIRALATDKEGRLYAGGYFKYMGGKEVNHIAKWDDGWRRMGDGADTPFILALAVDDAGNVYAGGGFEEMDGKEVNHIARWTGNRWYKMDDGVDGGVWSLIFDEQGNLYAGGGFDEASGVEAHNVAMWDGQTWSAVGEGTEWPVKALVFIENGDLCAGEVHEYTVGELVYYDGRISCWDGESWSTLEGEFDGSVDAMKGVGDILYVGGSFENIGEMPSTGIAAWIEMPPTLTPTITPTTEPSLHSIYMPLMRK